MTRSSNTHLLILCRACDARVRVRKTQIGSTVLCPRCDAEIAVVFDEPETSGTGKDSADDAPFDGDQDVAYPFDSDLASELAWYDQGSGEDATADASDDDGGGAASEDDEGETYRLASTPDRPAIRPEMQVSCPGCQYMIRAGVRALGRSVDCPRCGHAVYVPGHSGQPVAETDRRALKTQRTHAAVSGNLGESAGKGGAYLDRMADYRREALPKPPDHVFFSNVFNLPWRGRTLWKWLFLSFGCTVMGTLVAGLIYVATTMSGPAVLALAFLILPLIWVSVWTLSYAAACGVTVIEDTAAGNDEIVNWMDPNWREWAIQLMSVAYLGLLCAPFGYFVAWSVFLTTGFFWIPYATILFLMYPIILLSALEADSVMLPYSQPVLQSLYKLPGAWAQFYGLSALTVVLPLLLFAGLALVALPLACIATAPVFAAAILIYARLLGRLGWSMMIAARAAAGADESDESLRRSR